MPDPVQPGWQPDPQHPGMLRWWNGLGWSDARKAVDATAQRASEIRPIAEADLRRGVGTLAEARQGAEQEVARLAAGAPAKAARAAAPIGAAVATNPLAGTALALGVIGLILGFGVLSVVGFVVSLAALARSRRLAREGARRTGFGPSIGGLLLSVAGLLRWIPALVTLIGSFDIDLR